MAVTQASRIYLAGETAADLMTETPVCIRADASVRDAVTLLTDKGYSAAPVIDHAGHPVGVLSRSDILVHDREQVDYKQQPEYYRREELQAKVGKAADPFQVERVDDTRVRDIMTPAVFSARPDAPASRVISEMRALRVHRLFVVDESGVLVGVISSLDVLNKLSLE